MPAPTSARRRAVLATITALMLTTGVVDAPAAGAGTGFRVKLLRLVNASREGHDLHTLALNSSLSNDATRHTRKMLLQDRIFDPPNLQEILSRYPWDNLGAAAVGCEDSIRKLHEALMNSDVHRGILLDARLRHVGIGVIRADEQNLCGRGSFWVTEIFYG